MHVGERRALRRRQRLQRAVDGLLLLVLVLLEVVLLVRLLLLLLLLLVLLRVVVVGEAELVGQPGDLLGVSKCQVKYRFAVPVDHYVNDYMLVSR